MPKTTSGEYFIDGYLYEHCDVKPILKSEYGLSVHDALALAIAGDKACEKATVGLVPIEITDWPEAEIVQALLDKVDELEAKEATSD